MSMLVYAVHEGGRYVQVADSLKEQPEGKRGFYVNITNQCNCACTFCLRTMKHMAEESTLWLKQEPSVDEVKAELDKLPTVRRLPPHCCRHTYVTNLGSLPCGWMCCWS